MIRKLAACLITLTIAAVAVLVLRQQRLLAVAEMTEAAGRTERLERLLWEVRADIAELTTTDRIEQLASTLGPDAGELVPLTPLPEYFDPSVAMLDEPSP